MRPALLSLSRLFAAAVLTLALALPAGAQAAAQPPEVKEMQAAAAIADPAARLKELERILGAYPNSTLKPLLLAQVQSTKVVLALTLEGVLEAQRTALEATRGAEKVTGPAAAARQILDHPKLATFDKAKVVAAVAGYRELGRKAAADPAVLEATEARLREYLPAMAAELDIQLARAQAHAGEPEKALAILDAFLKGDGLPGAGYFLVRAEVLETLKRPQDAFAALVGAALENSRDGLRKTKEAWVKQHGKEDGFEEMLDGKRKELPFHPAPFKPGPAWKGKAVLAELFTGSECPPCVAADLAFDGLLESHPATTLVVLEYHLPIPQPDPMMNAASKKRQDYYGVNSTPTVVLDGGEKITGGGGRSMAAGRYKSLAGRIAGLVDGAPGAKLAVQASRKGDRVEVTAGLGTPLPEVDYQLVLVQGQQEHKGGNKVLLHKMVVRDLQTLDPAAKTAAFDLAASEKATDTYLTEFENTSTRFKGYKFPLRRHAIARDGLKVVLFAQERASKKVLQAVVADVQ